MTAFISKRQQARNERALQDLIRNVPGNDACADCQRKNPGWASWSLGIYLCTRCASIHRKLGTHISKVKSLSMDTWTSNQVEAMKRTGNVASNRTFNPRNVKPTTPLDPDDIDMEMEKFIRAKYQLKTLSADDGRNATVHHTGSTSSTDDRPPPVPEKNTPRLTSAVMATTSNTAAQKDRPLPPLNDPNRRDRLGSDALSHNDSNEEKLATLRAMGFHNEKRNLSLLKGLNGSVERTIEALVRFGEGDDATRTVVSARSNVPLPPRTNSLTVSTSPATLAPPDRAPVPQNHATASGAANINSQLHSPAKSYNPFDPPSMTQASARSTPPLDMSFQNMNISQQPLFPNNTGTWQIQNQRNPFLKNFTPPLSPSPYPGTDFPPQSTFPPNLAPQRGYTDPTSSINPFLRSSRSQTFTPSNLASQVQDTSQFHATAYSAHSTPLVSSVPTWMQAQRSVSQPVVFSQYQQQLPQGQMTATNGGPSQTPVQQFQYSQPTYQQSVFSDSPLSSPGLQGVSLYGSQQNPPEFPFQSQQTQHQLPSSQQQQYNFHPSSIQPSNVEFDPQTHAPTPQAQSQYQPPRLDKSSILALFNQHQSAPAPVQAQLTTQSSAPAPNPTGSPNQLASPPSNGSGHNNPFAKLTGNGGTPGGLSHIREESKDFAALMSRNPGRHSPDAFAGLSARHY